MPLKSQVLESVVSTNWSYLHCREGRESTIGKNRENCKDLVTHWVADTKCNKRVMGLFI